MAEPASVDPHEVVIAILHATSAITTAVGGRIAGKHRYGDVWTVGQTSIVANPVGGTADPYVPMTRLITQLRFYGDGQKVSMTNYIATLRALADYRRQQVTITAGAAYVYWFVPSGGPSVAYDTEIGMDMIVANFEIAVFNYVAPT